MQMLTKYRSVIRGFLPSLTQSSLPVGLIIIQIIHNNSSISVPSSRYYKSSAVSLASLFLPISTKMAWQITETMQALCLHDDSTVHYEAARVPVPSSTQILIRVSATALTRSDLSWGETLARPLAIPGNDVSGTVVSAPPTSKFKPGDEVFGLLAFNRDSMDRQGRTGR